MFATVYQTIQTSHEEIFITRTSRNNIPIMYRL